MWRSVLGRKYPLEGQKIPEITGKYHKSTGKLIFPKKLKIAKILTYSEIGRLTIFFFVLVFWCS